MQTEDVMGEFKIKRKRIVSGTVAASVILSSFVAIVTIAQNNPSDNPWDYSLFSSKENIKLNNTSEAICVEGDIRSNSNINLMGNDFYIDGSAVAAGNITDDVLIVDIGRKFENKDKLEMLDVWKQIEEKASDYGDLEFIENNIEGFSYKIDNPAYSDSELNINISSEQAPDTTSGQGKVGAFGAGFLANASENLSKWATILPLFNQDINISEDSDGYKNLLELADKSNFIMLQEQAPGINWKNYDSLPGTAITSNFSDNNVSDYITKVKEDNPVFNACDSDTVTIMGSFDNSTVNPEEALNAKSLTITGGHCALNGNYENLEKIKLDNWGGTQLIGDFPNLKYIYKTSWSNVNLAGNFPSLECIYMSGGQLLLGTNDVGFSIDKALIINESGPIAIYTAKDVTITNSEVLSSRDVLMRGAGKDKTESAFNVENTLFAAQNGVLFEDMNDCNIKRYENLPVFYSRLPISLINCNFKLMQGLHIAKNGAIIMAASDIDTMRGFLVAPNGINEYQASSATGFYIDTYSYNIPTNINSLNTQPNGSEKIGRISGVEYANFPKLLLEKIGNAEGFLNELNNTEINTNLGFMTEIRGLLTVDSYLLSSEDLNISCDNLLNHSEANSVIASHYGDITINVSEEMCYYGIIYAPNGKVTINGSGMLYGRIFAEEIEINSDYLEVNGANIDVEKLGFIETLPETEPTTVPVSTEESVTGTTTIQQNTSVTTTVTTVISDLPNETETTQNTTTTSMATDLSTTTTQTVETTTVTTQSPIDYNTNAKYEYDDLNRVVKAVYDDKNYIQYDYDANGNITKITVVKDGIIQQ